MILPFLEKLNFHDINKTHNLRGFGIKLASSIPLLKWLGREEEMLKKSFIYMGLW